MQLIDYICFTQALIHLPPAISDGAITPVQDMESMLAIYKELSNSTGADDQRRRLESIIAESLSALRRIVDMLVTTGGSNAHYRKALSCLKVNVQRLFTVKFSFF